MAKVKPKETSFSNLFVQIEYDNDQMMFDLWSVYDVIAKYKGRTDYYYERIIPSKMTLEELSFDLYDTPTLWWFIALYNDIIDPFSALDKNKFNQEKTLKIIKPEYLSEIFYAIKRAKRKK